MNSLKEQKHVMLIIKLVSSRAGLNLLGLLSYTFLNAMKSVRYGDIAQYGIFQWKIKSACANPFKKPMV